MNKQFNVQTERKDDATKVDLLITNAVNKANGLDKQLGMLGSKFFGTIHETVANLNRMAKTCSDLIELNDILDSIQHEFDLIFELTNMADPELKK